MLRRLLGNLLVLAGMRLRGADPAEPPPPPPPEARRRGAVGLTPRAEAMIQEGTRRLSATPEPEEQPLAGSLEARGRRRRAG